MKKFYAFAVVLSFLAESASAQNFYWIGNANGDWNTASNWSNTSGGSPASIFPNGAGHDVILDANASIRLSSSVSVNSVSLAGTTTQVSITGTGGGSIDLTVTSTTNALTIPAGCRLENSSIGMTVFRFGFADNTKASISGEWLFTGDLDNFAYFELPQTSGQTTAITINNGGSITVGPNTTSSLGLPYGDDYLIFSAGSSLNIQNAAPYIPAANYSPASTINITGLNNELIIFEESGSVGTVTINSPAQSIAADLSGGILTLTIKGNLNILNTNNKELILIDNIEQSLSSKQFTIEGNLNIQGNSIVTVASNDFASEPTNTLTVLGNVTANGTAFNLFTGPNISTNFTKLSVGGNISHTAGTFGSSSTVVNESADLFIIELKGTANQNISSVTGTFDNTGHQVTLRMNNAAGATLLTALQVGRIDFNTPNKGVLTTGGNLFSVNNATPASIVVNSPSATGYVNGTMSRVSQSTEPLVIPTGGATGYRPATLIPSSNTPTTFQATYFNTGYSDLSTASPLEGVTPDYYWTVDRISGTADAALQLSIPGQVTGSQPNYALVIAKYNGVDWVNEKGSTGVSVSPGDAASGTLRSQVQTSFSPFTIGYGLASALPTHLVSFTGRKAAKETIELKWQITDNSTPERFEVTRSSDGVNFVKIGSVAGAQYVRSYGFTDNSILAGNNYYRLRMLDKDGAVTFSTIVVVSNGAQGIYLNAVTPSVVQGRTRLNIQSSENTNMQLMVTDINGRIVHKQSVSLTSGSQDVWLDVSRFSSGVFHVTGFVKGVKTATLRFIKL